MIQHQKDALIDLIHRAQEIFKEGHNCDPFDVSSVFARGLQGMCTWTC